MKTRVRFLAPLVTVALLLGVTSQTQAATVRAFSLAGMTHAADEVVRGIVLGSHSIWRRFGDNPERLYTVTEIQVTRSFKGQTPVAETLLVMQLGGQDAGISQTVPGTVRFDDGDEVLVFARSDGALSYLVGMAQGAYFLTRAAGPKGTVGGSLHWSRGLLPTLHAQSDGAFAPARPDAANTWQATALEAAITELVASEGGRP